MTTKKEAAISCFESGLSIRETHAALRKKFGKCTRRTVEIVYKDWAKSKTGQNPAQNPAFSASASPAKPQPAKPEHSQKGGESPTSETISELGAKDPDDLFIETPVETVQEKPPLESPAPPAQETPVSPQPSQNIDVEGMMGQMQGLTVEELRELVKSLYLYIHTMPAQVLGAPATSEEVQQLAILGKMLGLRYIQDMRHVDLIFWGSILACELAFWSVRVPAALDKLKEIQAKMTKKDAPKKEAAPA